MLMTHGPDREYQLSHYKRGDTLYFQVSGDIDSQAVRIAYWQEIVELTRQSGLRKLLVIDRKKHKPATQAELAELAAIMHQYREIADRVAVVEPTPEFVPAIEHAEIEGRGVGINIRVFGNLHDAERWLMYGLSDEA
ncbi:MAG: hypothetical protein ACREO1_06430 [Arenimonas sp.]